MDRIKKLGLEKNTIIMFSSDNGTTFSAGVDAKFFNSVGGLRGLKMELYEGGIRVPFIVRWPGKIAANKTSDHMSIQYDMMATFAEITGKPVEKTDGISILPTLLGKPTQQKKHDFLYFEYPENGGQIAVRIGKWKGIKRNMRKDPGAAWELYNLDADPFENNNVAAQNGKIISEMETIAKREHMHPHVLDWEFIDPKVKKVAAQ
jgi:arylsulfatase A-like enzyme